MDEFELIARLFKPLAYGPESLGLIDDAALLAIPPGRQLVVTADMLQAEVHFFADDPAALIAHKALRVNLSDLAAMGADPYCYFLSLGLPRDMTEDWLIQFTAALAEDQKRYGIRLAGGDTTASRGPLSVSITALGTLPAGEALTRRGAKVGDDIYVTGTLGDAALGLTVRHSTHIVKPWRAPSVERYLMPQPRTILGSMLRGVATAAIDISDGFAKDLSHLCTASGIGADIQLASIPLSDSVHAAMADGFADWPLILSGGDDYELLFTAPKKRIAQIAELAETSATQVTRIGSIIKGEAVHLIDAEGQPLALESTGYRHKIGALP